MAFTKGLVRIVVITGLVGGAAAIVAGPDRLCALGSQTRGKIQSAIDGKISDPVALRAQLKSLEGTYPGRIAEVRGDLAELREQTRQLNRELEVSERVTQLSAADMDTMQGMIARAEEASASDETAIVRVVFNNEPVDLKEAYNKANRIRQVHNAYSSRAADIKRDLGYLAQQETRLTSLLDTLETEHAEFQAQMWALDRQVDSIARNDRMISMMEKRQRTIDEQSRYSANSLDQLQGRFADIRAKQEAKLEAFGTTGTTLNYEERAKFEIDTQKSYQSQPDATQVRPSSVRRFTPVSRTSVIEITPQNSKKPAIIIEQSDIQEAPAAPKPLASASR